MDAFYKYIYPNAYVMSHLKSFSLHDESDVQAMYILNSKYILAKEPINIEGIEEINKIGEIYIYRNIYTASIAKWYTNTISKDEYINLEKEEKNNILYDHIIIDDIVSLDKNAKATITNFTLNKQTEVTGDILSDGTGLLMIPIPNQEGWNAYIDDNLVDTYKVDYGFIGIIVPPGQHSIKFKYTLPKIKIGAICSLIGIINLLFIIFFNKRNLLEVKNGR